MGIGVAMLFGWLGRLPARLQALRAETGQGQMLSVDLELMVFADLLRQGDNGLVVEFLDCSASFAGQVPVAMPGLVERILDLIVPSVHSVDEPDLVQPF
jgi:hypothetical protein